MTWKFHKFVVFRISTRPDVNKERILVSVPKTSASGPVEAGEGALLELVEEGTVEIVASIVGVTTKGGTTRTEGILWTAFLFELDLGWLSGWLDGRLSRWHGGRLNGRLRGWFLGGAIEKIVICHQFHVVAEAQSRKWGWLASSRPFNWFGSGSPFPARSFIIVDAHPATAANVQVDVKFAARTPLPRLGVAGWEPAIVVDLWSSCHFSLELASTEVIRILIGCIRVNGNGMRTNRDLFGIEIDTSSLVKLVDDFLDGRFQKSSLVVGEWHARIEAFQGKTVHVFVKT